MLGGSFDRYAGSKSDAAAWIELYSGRPLKIDRKGSDEPLYAERAAVSIAGTIQPPILAKRIRAGNGEHINSGMAARFLLAKPPRRIAGWRDDDVDEQAMSDWSRLIGRLRILSFNIEGEAQEMTPTPEAIKKFAAWVDEVAAEIEAESDLAVVAALSKLEGTAARFALIFGLARLADDPLDMQAEHIEVEDMRAAVELARWFANEQRRVYAALQAQGKEDDDAKLLAKIEAKGGCISVRDWHRGNQRRLRTAEQAEAELKRLADAGHGEIEYAPVPDGGGKQPLIFRIAASPGEPGPRLAA